MFITRVGKPRLTDEQLNVARWDLGDEWDWAWSFPMAYRVLNNPRLGLPMPKAPTKKGEFFDYLGYWAALQHLLTYSFGWSRHDVGLKWLMGQRHLLDDQRAELINLVWGRDDTLWRYITWASGVNHYPVQPWMMGVNTSVDAPTYDVREELASYIDHEGLSGANNPDGMHLDWGMHIDSGQKDEYVAHIYPKPGSPGEAVYVADQVHGWYFGLNELAENLGNSGRTSWHVDVYVKQFGFMGTYRKSTVTGRWFTGKHSVHMVGNPIPEWEQSPTHEEAHTTSAMPAVGEMIAIDIELTLEQRTQAARTELKKLLLEILKSEDYWTIELDRPDNVTPPYIQGIQEDGGWSIEAVSNKYADPPLTQEQLDQLKFLAFNEPEGSELPNYWRFEDDADEATDRLVKVFFDVFNYELSEDIRVKTSDGVVNEYIENHFLVEINKLSIVSGSE